MNLILEEGIVDNPGRFGYCQGCGVGKLVIVAYHKGVEGVLCIDIGMLGNYVHGGRLSDNKIS